MARAIHPILLTQLRWLDQRADELRRELELHQRGETVTSYTSQTDPERFFEVVADGYGSFTLVDYRGIDPGDRDILHEATYDDDRRAWYAAMRLGECGVDWAQRDVILGDIQDVDAADVE